MDHDYSLDNVCEYIVVETSSTICHILSPQIIAFTSIDIPSVDASKFESAYGGFEEKEYNNVYRYVQQNEYPKSVFTCISVTYRRLQIVRRNYLEWFLLQKC